MKTVTPDSTFEALATLALFGFPATPATVRIRAHSKSWRVGGAIRIQAVGLVLAPMVALVPPHVPWALGALAGSFFLARRRWHHRFTVEAVAGGCPKCGKNVAPRPAMLRARHALSCDGCHHELTLVLAAGALDGHEAP